LGNGMQLAGWSTYAQYIVRGIILLGAVAFDEYQKNRKSKKKIKPPVEGVPGDPKVGGGVESAAAE
ncbi:MAG: hypothetical protein HGA28_02150, partial [Anaerolineaceae bacterium]|nr:hypothetical protein [Anaerolineaceae bacterium]